MKCSSLISILLAIPLMAEPAWPDEGGILTPGPALERSISAGETHVYRVEASDTPLAVIVEQRGIDLIVEAKITADQKALSVDSLNDRWGAEVLVVSPGNAGGSRIEVRPGVQNVPPGRYTIRMDLPGSGEDEQQRVAAWAAMSRAGLLSSVTSEAQQQALAAYREALEAWRTLGEKRWEAETLYLIAALERLSGNVSMAVEELGEAAAIWRDLSEPRREAAVLRALGAARLRAGEIEAAREAMERSIALWQGFGERSEEAGPRSDLCALELTSGSLSAAPFCYEEARALFREIGDGSQEARMLNHLGGVYDILGEPDAALDYYGQALGQRRRLGDRRGEAETLNNIAEVHRALGEWQEALRIFGEAREILEPLGDQALEGTLLNNVAFTYMALGEGQRALPFFQDALKLRRQIGARGDELITLNNLGSVWRRLGDPEKALGHYRQALELALKLKDSRQEALTRLSLAEIELDKGDSSEALCEIDSALTYLRENSLRPGELGALRLQGRALALSSQPWEALPVMEEVLAQYQASRDRAGEAEAFHSLAAVERSLGLLTEARAHAEAAVARAEDLRTGFVSPDLRAAFLATQRRAYSLLIDLLMDRHAADGGGYDRAAFEISEQARARSLLDALYAGNAQRPGTAVPAELAGRRRFLRRRLSAKADQQLKQSGERAEALGREIGDLLAELDSVEEGIRRVDPQYAAISKPQPISVQRITGLLDPGTVLLEYSLGEQRSFLWVIGAGGLHSFVLPPQREIEGLARRAYEELRTVEPGFDHRPDAAEALSRKVLGPAWSEVAGARRLVIVPDGALHLLPFGALPVPGPGQSWDAPGWKPLLEDKEVVYVPSATTLELQRERLERRPPATKFAAVLADPVFAADDPRLTGHSAVNRKPSTAKELTRGEETRDLLPVFERLPSSAKEAEAIRVLATPSQVWTALGFAASREAVLSGEIHSYQVVHFATHGIADARNPELSGLVLSRVDANGRPQEGFLGLSDVYELDLTAGLVVLSGCQTALGKEVSGEGVMGLTRGFLYAGVPRVVASLWKVQDRTTAELMTRFYRAMWKDHLSPAAALREAQKSLRREPRYRDPYSWAGFVLQGDWR